MTTSIDKNILTLFVYGTLTRASHHPFARRLAMESRFIGRGTVNGLLYSLGRYPGLVEDPGEKYRVHGEAVQLKNARSLAWLDDYEGCGPNWPAPQDYERKLLPVRLLDGAEIRCWIYVYKGSVSGFRRMPDGRFMPL